MQTGQVREEKRISSGMIFLLAAACGFIVANLYYAQTLVGQISVSTGLSSAAAGIIVTITQIGYVVGLLFVVPISDLIENRRLATISLAVLFVALLAAAFAPNAPVFLAASLLIGLGSVVAQILVPFATYLASEEQRGRVVGNVMSGLLLGIMFARPLASFIASVWIWRVVFVISAILIAVLAILLVWLLPQRRPASSTSYRELIVSLAKLFKDTPILRRRAFYQACLFGAFSLFWTAIPMQLTDRFGMSQQGIALFALAGVGGAVAAPIAGRLADKGWTRLLTGLAMAIAAISFMLTYLFQSNSTTDLVLLVLAAIMLDMAVSGNLVLGQRAIYSLGSEARGRLNGLFMSIFFVGGAIGSLLASWSYAYGGWDFTSWIGAALPMAALVYYFTDKKM
ncbi:MFS transporter [Cohnella zeiphila]|uniref:MFS transporter n=1 Tax=Cohnella zeiphila TaxID=2761120 RepID=A0A7X0SP09_9BACL|nr:MFS transporter [Cohnella zeiphila]MBB6733414.1 MFS transporter [Cohnella zeiphila]